MKKIILVLLAVFIFSSGYSQEQFHTKTYWKSASEFIFSFGNVDANSEGDSVLDVSPVVRFSGFFHLQEQFHIDFSEHFGIYTGMGVRNIGMINKVNDSIKVKQRSYSVGIPIAIKIGNMRKGAYVAIGGEAELMFHYKQKVFYDDQKKKNNEWFSDKVNILNPSGFAEIVTGKGSYLRFKYYFLDFLVDDKQDIKLYNGFKVEYVPEKSQLFSISIGATFKHTPHRAPKPVMDDKISFN